MNIAKNSMKVGLVSILLFGLESHAGTLATTTAYLNVGSPATPITNTDGDLNDPTSSHAFTRISRDAGTYSMYSEAEARPGVLKAITYGTASSTSRVESDAQAQFTDKLLFSDSRYNGTRGWAELNFYSEWLIDAAGDNKITSAFALFAAASFSPFNDKMNFVTVQQNRLAVLNGECYTCSFVLARDDLDGVSETNVSTHPGYVTLKTDFIWGQPFEIIANVLVGGLAYEDYDPKTTEKLSGNGYYGADAAHSAYWAGVGSVTSNDIVVANYQLNSASGTDYTSSFVPQRPNGEVPEPNSFALVVLATVGLSLNRRRKQ
jgi:hypothetical protein